MAGKTTKYDPRGDKRAQGNTKSSGRYANVGHRTVDAALLVGGDTAQQAGTTIDALLARGDAIMFSKSADGGIVVITIFSGDEREKIWCKTQQELDQTLADLENAAKGD